jgi:dipeptidyl aminopeptidase/acylaminoacyl peptidase
MVLPMNSTRILMMLWLGVWCLGSIPAQTLQKFDYLDIYNLEYIESPAISPAGDNIVYLRNQFDLMTDRKFNNLWMYEVETGKNYPLSSGKNAISSPQWSPQGDRLAYFSAEEGKTQLFVHWLQENKKASLTHGMSSPSQLQWSPDGRWLAFAMKVPALAPSLGKFPGPPKGAQWAEPAVIIESSKYRADGNFSFVEPGYTHIFVISAQGGAPRQITYGDYNHGAPQWSADGKSLYFSANREEKPALKVRNTQIYKVGFEGGEILRITRQEGPHDQPVVSPDGQWIAFTGFEDKKVGYQLSRLFLMKTDGSERREIAHGLDLDVGQLTWDKDSKGLYAYVEKRGVGNVYYLPLNGKATALVGELGGASLGRPYSGGSYAVSKNGRIAFTHSRVDRPAELALWDKIKGTLLLTDFNENFLSGRKLGKVEEMEYLSSHDGQKIQGWMIYPPDFEEGKKYPLILEIHGGPHLSYGPHFSPELQMMASQGYLVLYTNPRGSTSYGEDFAAWINGNYPSQDYDDLMSGIDALVERGCVDTSRLYITGGSGGGVLTAWSIGKNQRFAAAVVSKPVINWYSFVLTSDGTSYYSQYWFDEKPWENPMKYMERSPISLVGNVKTPTLLITGEQDYRTPMSETEQYYNALRLQEVETLMIRIPNAGHGITQRPSNMIRHVGYIVGWFDRYAPQ